uniref:Dihydropteridine reductase n=1 Tax=Cacopsylla melanoneura TaxID=428564 RepID=A0A8D8XWR3_9HEMI
MAGKIFIYGGRGALGSAVVSHFKAQNWWVGSIDLNPNDQADANIIVNKDDAWLEQETTVLAELKSILAGDKIDAVICVAGGWAGGNAAAKDFVKNADAMWRQSVWSSVLAASIAAKHLKPGGFVSLPGAKPALSGTPGMIGYGMAKAAVHQLTKSLACENSGLPENSLAIALLPVTLDTPMNRKWMPDADTSTWTPLQYVAELFWKWTNGQERPPNGSLIELETKNNETKLNFH